MAGIDMQKYIDGEITRDRERTKKKIFYALALLGAMYIVAIELYHYLEGWDWLDAIYFTTATITTVGYGDLVPRTEIGKMVTIPLMLIGIGVGFYVIFAIQEYGRSRMDMVAKHIDGQISGKGRDGKDDSGKKGS
ncbi:MAG: potassium channel family protein [Candidatus Micrarchaeia archaeon]|jgi:voltage-gated potassium channel Kch